MEATKSLDSSSSEDLDDLCIDHEIDDIDITDVTPRKPHFLDYDAIPPPGFEDNDNNLITTDLNVIESKIIVTPTSSLSSPSGGNVGYPGENVKLDKKYERDGEISDYELAACGITKREQTKNSQQKHQQLLQKQQQLQQQQQNTGARKKKHFLDENPIPPDYMLINQKDNSHNHPILDKDFEKHNDYETLNKTNDGGDICGNDKFDKKYSLDREERLLIKRKDASYTLSRFIESQICPPSHPPPSASSLARGTWPIERPLECSGNNIHFSSMPEENLSSLGSKVECVYSLLSMLGSHDPVEMSKKFLELSRKPETCAALRRSGCIPLLVQMMHSDSDDGVRKRAASALHNVVNCHPDDKAGRREAKVLRLIEQIMDYCNFLKTLLMSGGEAIADDTDRHPLAAISSLMKVSFDEEHRHAMCQLGALQAIAGLVHLDHAVHGPKLEDQCCNSLRRYALMALTNLTFGDGNNKALLCANKEFMEALVAQLDSAPDDLLQVTASVLRNLSWRADNNMKGVLNEIGTVTALAKAAMKNKNENTLKAILSALWNLSAHCSMNKAEFCSVEGALAFLVDMLTYEGPSKTLKIIENAGGILRNVSSHIAVREDYRKILRQRNCLGILLQQLKSESLTVVSNACGTLWNLSARCPEDQKYLWDNGAVPMLRSLVHSKHKMISEGSSAALKNLLNFRPGALNQNNMDPIAKAMGLKELPTLNARKQRALEQELNRNLAETCDNLDVITPPKEKKEFSNSHVVDMMMVDANRNITPGSGICLTRSAIVSKSQSRDSIVSAKSDSVYEKSRRGHSAPPISTKNDLLSSKDKSSRNTFKSYSIKRELDVEQVEQPIDYSARYNSEDITVSQISARSKEITTEKIETKNYSAEYQETDLDQPTDFSLRYAENQVEECDAREKSSVTTGVESAAEAGASGSEIILILEDTVKCYQTEGTPYIISNAGSITDLRNPKPEEIVSAPVKRLHSQQHHQNPKTDVTMQNNYGSGTYTPEKPIYYCDEGTPGYFSRYESLSSLDESPPNCNTAVVKVKPEVVREESSPEHKIIDIEPTESAIKCDRKVDVAQHKNSAHSNANVVDTGIIVQGSNISNVSHRNVANSAQETPLMFSRRSSMDSIASAEQQIIPDDKSSVVSDFSRLASGIISPSELPDSPTQSMPQSPRRNSSSSMIPSTSQRVMPTAVSVPSPQQQQRLRSVFEDDVNTFRVENTPAQFSCATSLSNLSLDDEPKIATDTIIKEMSLMDNDDGAIETESNSKSKDMEQNKASESCAISDGEETANDDLLLATCINIGMNKVASSSKINKVHSTSSSQSHHKNTTDENCSNLATTTATREITVGDDIVKQYCTEDTPALMSKVGSNSNLSVLSIATTNKEEEEVVNNPSNLSDISSNASDGGYDLLEQCIREGMQQKAKSSFFQGQEQNQKSLPKQNKIEMTEVQQTVTDMQQKDPIAMLKRGGLPPYLPVRDEMNKFLVEDSPCNFSIISGLSNLTVGSGVAGPANMKRISSGDSNEKQISNNVNPYDRKQKGDDSLSSISIESEDDTNLLSQAIAAGFNKTKQCTSKQATDSTDPVATTSKYLQPNHPFHSNFNETAHDSLSSIDSSDSNDYHSKSLLEQCIITGMNKQQQKQQQKKASTARHQQQQQQQQQNISPKRSQLPTLSQHHTSQNLTKNRNDKDKQKERERKDEQLLRECINTGIATKSVRHHQQSVINNQNQIKPPAKHVRRILAPTDFSQRLVTGAAASTEIAQPSAHQQFSLSSSNASIITTVPKNGETTSVAALEQHQLVTIISQSARNTAPGVVGKREPPEGISITTATTTTTINSNSSSSNNNNNSNTIVNALKSHLVATTQQQQRQQQQQVIYQQAEHCQQTGSIWAQQHQQQQQQQREPILQQRQQQQNITGSDLFITSQGSLNLSGDGFLDQSNEFPALKTSHIDSTENSVNESSFEMDVSNEFLIEKEHNSEEDASSLRVSQKIIHDKHKDPDLMLKSVERLTQELVSTAEYLRTNYNSGDNKNKEFTGDFDNSCSMSDKILNGNGSGGGESNSNSNNTWNEDTCPNDVSFPSVSLTVPMITSLNDDETTISETVPSALKDKNHELLADNTPTNEVKNFIVDKEDNSHDTFIILDERFQYNSQPNSLETETDTLINDEIDGSVSSTNSSNHKNNSNSNSNIQFKVGGEVQQQFLNARRANNCTSSGPMSFDSSSVMTNSTIIAMEANKLANDLMLKMSDSTTSLDLDNIRPPSCMDNLSISGCFDMSQPQSPQLSRLRKKSLPPGLVARRALAGGQFNYNICGMSGSVESVNSTYNLDNVKPPSLMDELLDSMISVDSITSEIVDNNSLGLQQQMTSAVTTNYETAFSDVDDNTTTLQSCMDALLPHDCDSNAATPLPSDFSSAESTPRKGQQQQQQRDSAIPGIKRALTPKQKRRIIKDRYKTYTIAADYVLKEDFGQNIQNQEETIHDKSQSYEEDEDDEIIRIEIEHERETKDVAGNNLAIIVETDKNQSNNDEEWFNETLVGDTEMHLSDQSSTPGSVRRRSIDPDRYKTRTIVYNLEAENLSEQIKSTDCESLTSNEEETEDLPSIYALTKQFKHIYSPTKSQTTISPSNHIISLIRSKMIEDEKRTITMATTAAAESDYNSMECDQNSETESCGGSGKCIAVDINSQNKIQKIQVNENGDNEELENGQEQVSPKTISKPKILKPNDKDSGTEFNCSEDSMTPPETTIKTVRGRKKPEYVSPYSKRSVLSNSSSRTTSPKSQICNGSSNNTTGASQRANLATKTTNPEVKKTFGMKNLTKTSSNKTHVLVNKSSIMASKLNAVKSTFAKTNLKNTVASTSSTNTDIKMITKKNLLNKSSLKQENEVTLPKVPLERQGTFVKDEPSNVDQIPVVNSLPSSPSKTSRLPMKLGSPQKLSNIPKSPLKSSVVKTRPPIQPKNMSVSSKLRPSSSVDVTKKKQSSLFGGLRKSNMPSIPQRSNSNTTIRTNSNTSVAGALRTDLPSTTPPSRSNSNLTSARTSTSSTAGVITSRIAGVWKKTTNDESKKTFGRQQSTTSKQSLTLATKNKIIRSSTFDNGISQTNDAEKGIVSAVNQNRRIEIPTCNTSTFIIRRSKNIVKKQNTSSEDVKSVVEKRVGNDGLFEKYGGNNLRTETVTNS